MVQMIADAVVGVFVAVAVAVLQLQCCDRKQEQEHVPKQIRRHQQAFRQCVQTQLSSIVSEGEISCHMVDLPNPIPLEMYVFAPLPQSPRRCPHLVSSRFLLEQPPGIRCVQCPCCDCFRGQWKWKWKWWYPWWYGSPPMVV